MTRNNVLIQRMASPSEIHSRQPCAVNSTGDLPSGDEGLIKLLFFIQNDKLWTVEVKLETTGIVLRTIEVGFGTIEID